MEILCVILCMIGAIAMIVGHFWLVVIAFKKSVVWGLVTFFVPFWGSLVFLILNFESCKKPLLVYIAGFAMIPISVIPMMMFSPDKFKEMKSKYTESDTTIKTDGAAATDGAATTNGAAQTVEVVKPEKVDDTVETDARK